MSSIKVSGNASGTGILTIAAPNTSTDRTLTLPDNTGTFLTTATAGVPIGGPAFSAYSGAAQSISASTNTKLQCNTEEFDTNSNYDNTTNYRFTPSVAGYYQVSAAVTWTTAVAVTAITIYKNGASFKTLQFSNNATVNTAGGSALIYLNGATDYVEIYVSSGFSNTVSTSNSGTYFQAALIRSGT